MEIESSSKERSSKGSAERCPEVPCGHSAGGRISHLIDALLQGDAMELMPRLPAELADMVFFDPPYFLQLPKKRILRWKVKTVVEGVSDEWDHFSSFEEYDSLIERALSQVKRIMKPNGTIWCIGTYHNIFRIGTILQNLGFWTLNDVIWLKSNPMPNWLGVRFTNGTETLIWAVKDKSVKDYTFNRAVARRYSERKIAINMWRLPLCAGRERLKKSSGKKLHSAQKPEALLERIIAVSTQPGDLVFDPMAGTGTTGAVAKWLGRHFLMIERDPEYCEAARLRLEGTKGGLGSLSE